MTSYTFGIRTSRRHPAPSLLCPPSLSAASSSPPSPAHASASTGNQRQRREYPSLEYHPRPSHQNAPITRSPSCTATSLSGTKLTSRFHRTASAPHPLIASKCVFDSTKARTTGSTGLGAVPPILSSARSKPPPTSAAALHCFAYHPSTPSQPTPCQDSQAYNSSTDLISLPSFRRQLPPLSHSQTTAFTRCSTSSRPIRSESRRQWPSLHAASR